MEKYLFSVYDQKAKVFSNPFYSVNNATAIRDFERAVNDSNTDLNRFPNDYSLYCLGIFDDNSGLLTPEKEPVHLGFAAQFIQEVLT